MWVLVFFKETSVIIIFSRVFLYFNWLYLNGAKSKVVVNKPSYLLQKYFIVKYNFQSKRFYFVFKLKLLRVDLTSGYNCIYL